MSAVYVNRTGDKVSSPNTKEQLCEAIEQLAAENRKLRLMLAEIVAPTAPPPNPGMASKKRGPR